MNNSLSHPPSDYINGKFVALAEGDAIVTRNPAWPDDVIWQAAPNIKHIDSAMEAARNALPAWSRLSLNDRAEYLQRWKEVTAKRAEQVAALITDEMGKTLAESLFEAKALGGKVDITLGKYSMDRIAEYEVAVNKSRSGHCRYKPFGVMAVIGPFNFPAHLPNGHFIPALLTGNTIVFKPSEKTAAAGQMLAEMIDEINLPAGVFNLVHGAGDVAAKLVDHDDIDGVLFTGSWPVGRKILESNLDRPGRMIALEMGGNNPAVVMDDAHFKQAVVECARSAFATTGQRCTCTRRILVHEKIAPRFISALCKMASTLVIAPGRPRDGAMDGGAPSFMGPLISKQAVQHVLDFQKALVKKGATVRLESTAMDMPGHFITPGVIEVDRYSRDRDCEIFGPLVQVCTFRDLDDAIEQCNATQYGLAASIFTQSESNYQQFFDAVSSGCINWNTGTAGASSELPFGGTKRSGNHRPAGSFSTQYCAYPIANMIETGADAAIPAGMMWDDAWAK